MFPNSEKKRNFLFELSKMFDINIEKKFSFKKREIFSKKYDKRFTWFNIQLSHF